MNRHDWFRAEARKVIDRQVLVALDFGSDPTDAQLAFAAALTSTLAVMHGAGRSLGELALWAQARLGDQERAGAFARAAYGHIRRGTAASGFGWDPARLQQSLLSWLQVVVGDQSVSGEAGYWDLDAPAAEAVKAAASAWDKAQLEPLAIRVPSLAPYAAEVAMVASDGLGDSNTSAVLVAIAQDRALLKILTRVSPSALAVDPRDLADDLEQRLRGLTPLEAGLLEEVSADQRLQRAWIDHSYSVINVNEVRAIPGGGTTAFTNAVPDRLLEDTLVPDWLDEALFNGRYIAGIDRGGPTAHAWLAPRDIDDLQTLVVDLDIEPRRSWDERPPPLAIYWRDETRQPDDWSFAALLLSHGAETWSWLARFALSRTLIVDALQVDSDGDVEIFRRFVVKLPDEFFDRWSASFPQPPSISQRLGVIPTDHVLGGLQAAERSKSFDLMELNEGGTLEEEVSEARKQVLEAEARRAESVWGDQAGGDHEVERNWARFRETRAWRVGASHDGRLVPDTWLQERFQGITTDRRAVVHMMVSDGLELFWVGDGGNRHGYRAVGDISDLLAALEPWSSRARLAPGPQGDPVGAVLSSAARIADELRDLAVNEGFDHLVVIPWRALHSVPWSFLQLTDGEALDATVRVTHAPAASMLRREPVLVTGREVVAISTHGGTLRHADAEVDIVAHIHAARTLADGCTTSEILEALRGARIVHVSGHAEAAKEPLVSSLLGGRPPLPADRILSAARIHASADLEACMLVVLNTCNSGRYAARPTTFENHTGFDTACLAAGATAVLSTLWPVDDLVATIVGSATHWYLAQGQPPHVALRTAVDALRHGRGSRAIPTDLADVLDQHLDRTWRLLIDDRAAALQHPYWWAAWRISGADWLLD